MHLTFKSSNQGIVIERVVNWSAMQQMETVFYAIDAFFEGVLPLLRLPIDCQCWTLFGYFQMSVLK